MGVSENIGTPNHPFQKGFPLFSPSILGYPYFWKHPNMPNIRQIHLREGLFPSTSKLTWLLVTVQWLTVGISIVTLLWICLVRFEKMEKLSQMVVSWVMNTNGKKQPNHLKQIQA